MDRVCFLCCDNCAHEVTLCLAQRCLIYPTLSKPWILQLGTHLHGFSYVMETFTLC